MIAHPGKESFVHFDILNFIGVKGMCEKEIVSQYSVRGVWRNTC